VLLSFGNCGGRATENEPVRAALTESLRRGKNRHGAVLASSLGRQIEDGDVRTAPGVTGREHRRPLTNGTAARAENQTRPLIVRFFASFAPQLRLRPIACQPSDSNPVIN